MSRHIEKKIYITAINIIGGIITLIEPDGRIGYYRQRGMGSVDERVMSNLVYRGVVNGNWKAFHELPRNYQIAFEDTEIMGRAIATFNPKNYM